MMPIYYLFMMQMDLGVTLSFQPLISSFIFNAHNGTFDFAITPCPHLFHSMDTIKYLLMIVHTTHGV
jgi:hypothetical protein